MSIIWIPTVLKSVNYSQIWDRIKGLKLRRCSNLNYTYHGKLRRHSRAAAACLLRCLITLETFFSHILRLVYCGLCTAAGI